MARSWLATITAAAIAALGAGACAPSEEEVRAEFHEFVASRDDCETSDECVLVFTECPLGCFHAVNAKHAKSVERKARELVDDYESGGRACAYDCQQAFGAVCEQGQCVVEDQPDAGQAR